MEREGEGTCALRQLAKTDFGLASNELSGFVGVLNQAGRSQIIAGCALARNIPASLRPI
jgi:hypothetical protein